ncbi:MAG: NTP/NDP exchange transporter [Endomicrobium sp.]|nr:NTP/NDP exchange transporter [Endomicrobium sp.]
MAEFTGLKSVLWPIHKFELKKFLPMAFIMFCILLNYSLLRIMKDSLVVTTMGASVVPTIKLWFVIPSTILLVIIYSKLVNIFSKDSVFYIMVTFFMGYFILFATILYPYHQYLHADFSDVSSGLLFGLGLLKPIGHWVFSSFYVMAELWGSSMIGLMFWRFANDVTSIKESKRFYAMFLCIANFGLVITCLFVKVLNDERLDANEWSALPYFILIVVISCLVIIGLYYWLNNDILKDSRYYNPDEIKKPKEKAKLSMLENLKYIFKSKYLGYIALLLICYGISINLIEVVWKEQVCLLYPTKAGYSSFMGHLNLYTGVFTIICTLIGTNILRRCSWFVGAIITPITFFITGLVFFAFIIFKEQLTSVVTPLGLTVLGIVISFGFIQNFLSKGVKYSFFDPTKEMCYIPLDDELKSKGRAAVDIVGARVGKGGGSFIQYMLLNVIFIGSSLVQLVPVIAVIFVVILLLWFVAVFGLNKKFLHLTKDDIK